MALLILSPRPRSHNCQTMMNQAAIAHITLPSPRRGVSMRNYLVKAEGFYEKHLVTGIHG